MADQFEHQRGEAGGGTADRKRRAGEAAGQDAADDAGDQAALRRRAGGDGDAEAERQGYQENNKRRGKVVSYSIGATLDPLYPTWLACLPRFGMSTLKMAKIRLAEHESLARLPCVIGALLLRRKHIGPW
jgi:hypothetical protein